MTIDVYASTQAGYFRGIWRIGNLFQMFHVIMDFDFCVHKSEQTIQLGCLFVVPDVLLVVSPSTSGSPQNVEQNRYSTWPNPTQLLSTYTDHSFLSAKLGLLL